MLKLKGLLDFIADKEPKLKALSDEDKSAIKKVSCNPFNSKYLNRRDHSIFKVATLTLVLTKMYHILSNIK